MRETTGEKAGHGREGGRCGGFPEVDSRGDGGWQVVLDLCVMGNGGGKCKVVVAEEEREKEGESELRVRERERWPWEGIVRWW